VIGSHLRVDDPFDPSGRSAEHAAAMAHEVATRAG
jgi:purine nucleosidase